MSGYSHYRGRRMPWAKRLAMIGMVLVILLCGAYLALSKYAEFDSEGKKSFNLPWQREESSGGEEKPEVSLIIEEAEDPLEEMHAVEIAALTLRERAEDGAWWENEGYNAVILRLKEDDGLLWYTSEAAKQGLIHENALSRAELKELLESDVYVAAKISCFRDTAAALSDMTGLGLCQSSGYIWYDDRNGHWLDPGKEEAQDYLLALCEELAELGFDEIVLENAHYPIRGKLQKSDPVNSDKNGTVERFLKEVSGVFSDKEVRLSLALEEEILFAGGSEAAGLVLEKNLAHVLRVYLQTEEPAVAETALRELSKTAELVLYNAEEGARCDVLS